MPKTFLEYILRYLMVCFVVALTAKPALAAVLVKNKMWPNNSVLNVVFIDGSEQHRDQVKLIAPLWLENSGLKFQFYDNFSDAPKKSHIRISFTDYTGSQLGDHGDYYSKTPTLLLGELAQSDLATESSKRFILHEFGHALGFEHEYRNPKWPYGNEPIERQIEKCVPRIEKIGYNAQEAVQKCREINSPLTKDLVNATVYDEHSIMNYPQAILLKNKTLKQIAAKSKLSILDKLAVQRWYGK